MSEEDAIRKFFGMAKLVIRQFQARAPWLADDIESAVMEHLFKTVRFHDRDQLKPNHVYVRIYNGVIDRLRQVTKSRRKYQLAVVDGFNEKQLAQPEMRRDDLDSFLYFLNRLGLHADDKAILKKYFFDGADSNVIAAEIGVSPSRVCQRIRGILNDLRERHSERHLTELI